MGVSYQQKSAQRKMIYFGIIVVLLTLTLFVRFSGTLFHVRPDIAVAGLKTQAVDLQLREQDLGKVELTSKAVGLTLTGSRGFVICSLWLAANDKQMRHEWNELELLITSITKIQPYFVSPWLFQSWNLAYNVARESDRPRDKYFYVARGLQLLADGQDHIRASPDMRQMMGTYYMSKFGLSDERDTMRSLFQMSCIDPLDRDPALFARAGNPREVDMERFENFCRSHPHLLRRLRESPDKKPDEALRKTPQEVVAFLREYQKIPSRFEDANEADRGAARTRSRYRRPLERFPIMPPVLPRPPYDQDIATNDSDLDDEFDSPLAAKAWYAYAQDPLQDGRRPRFMNYVLFKGWPARAQASHAEWLEKEGWFDEKWDLSDWFPQRKLKVEVGDEGRTAEAWDKAFQMYLALAHDQHLDLSPEEEKRLIPEERRRYQSVRGMTNIAHFLATTRVERTKPAIAARKYFHNADWTYWLGFRPEALELYENPAAFGPPATWESSRATGWKKLLLDHADFRNDLNIQQDGWEVQMKYLDLVHERRGLLFKHLLVLTDYLGQAANPVARGGTWVPPGQLGRNVSVPLKGPLDDVDQLGQPFVSGAALQRTRGSAHLGSRSR